MEFWRSKLVNLEFVDKNDDNKKKTWIITDVVYRPGKKLSTYIVQYKFKGRGTIQEMKGYESQIVELFDVQKYPWFTKRRLEKLGMYDKYLEIKKKQEGLI